MKACLVVPFYFGPRRIRSGYQTFTCSEDVINLAKCCFENYSKWDPGCDTDIIFVNNSPEVDSASEYLKEINGSKTHSGKLIVIEGNNIGMGFGAHNLAFETFREEYDFWLFTEDDVIINKPNLMKTAIEQLLENEKIGFIACYGLAGDHAHGGIGCTSKINLEKVYAKRGKLPFHNSIPNLENNAVFKSTHIRHGEVAFTKCYIELGLSLKKIEANGIPFARWDAKDSPHCDRRDKDIWGELAECLREKFEKDET